MEPWKSDDRFNSLNFRLPLMVRPQTGFKLRRCNMDSSILIVLSVLTVTVFLLVSELVRIDVAAIICMLALAWMGVLAPHEALSGFSSNAVIAMMAVMVMGQGVARTGLMDRFSRAVVGLAGTRRTGIVAMLSVPVGLVSGLIQNIGSVALFLPGVLDIARREKIAASSLIMPIGFAAILGGTLTMVGSGPLILTNDLLSGANLAPYGLFSVTPVGLALLALGIGYFALAGRLILPDAPPAGQRRSDQEQLIDALRLPHDIRYYTIPAGSPLQGKTPDQAGVWGEFRLNIVGLSSGGTVEYAPWRETTFQSGQVLALIGDEDSITRFGSTYGLRRETRAAGLGGLEDPELSGFAEVVIPPRSVLAGESIRSYGLRHRHAVEPVMVFSKGQELRGDFSEHVILPGDTFVVFGPWEHIDSLKNSKDFVVMTPVAVKKYNRAKASIASVCFVLAIGLTFAGAPISIAFLTGAIAMVLTRVLSIQDAYDAIEWKVVFLLAGLIPLGLAMEKTGTAAFLAGKAMVVLKDAHPVFLFLAVAVLSTVFSLFMSNVGAIVVLVPLVIQMAAISGLDPRPLALMAAVCAANSFVLPTHQVNAMLMSAGGYRNADYLKAGSGLTVLFILVVVSLFYTFYL
jgi:di/tricarboxylate transporter